MKHALGTHPPHTSVFDTTRRDSARAFGTIGSTSTLAALRETSHEPHRKSHTKL